jgi:hypothetical protein
MMKYFFAAYDNDKSGAISAQEFLNSDLLITEDLSEAIGSLLNKDEL